jgi:hypothetical protein
LSEYNSGVDPDLDLSAFNELDLSNANTTGFTHNVGPMSGWGPGDFSRQSCIDNQPWNLSIIMRGYNSEMVPLELSINLEPQSCWDGSAYVQIDVDHNQGRTLDFSQLMNDNDDPASTIDWTGATWTGTMDYTSSQSYLYNYQQTPFGLEYNMGGPGPAWVYFADPSTTYCSEGVFQSTLLLTGELPTGEVGQLELVFLPTNGNCFPENTPWWWPSEGSTEAQGRAVARPLCWTRP